MKIGLCASENIDNDIDFNISQIEGFIEKTSPIFFSLEKVFYRALILFVLSIKKIF